jgi:hypothetical protein
MLDAGKFLRRLHEMHEACCAWRLVNNSLNRWERKGIVSFGRTSRTVTVNSLTWQSVWVEAVTGTRKVP